MKREEAARQHSESEGDNGNAEISFLAGAEWEAKRVLELLRSELAQMECRRGDTVMIADWLESELKEGGK